MPAKATILIVDDEAVIRDLLARTLAAPDRHIITAADGEEAKRHAAATQSIEVALVDKNLPGANGLEVIRALRTRHADAACVIMTAYPTTESAAESVRLGLFDYLTKPFENLADVEGLIGRAIGQVHRTRDDRERQRGLEEQSRHAVESARMAVGVTADATVGLDPLTGLLGRAAFVKRTEAALLAAQAGSRPGFAVLVLDLNDFGRINDSLGHAVGDEVLQKWAERVASLVRPNDVFARMGADQFTLLLNGIRDAEQAVEVALRISRLSAEPFSIAGREVSIGVSAGINLSELGYERADDLLRDAGTALARAKTTGRGTQVVFAREMHSRAVELLTIDQDLKAAATRREFIAHYQPILAVESNRVVSFEALARWQHPQRGLLAPDQFLARASETGCLADISWQIAEVACATQRRWLDKFGAGLGLTVSLNVAPPLLLRPGFVADVERLIARHALQPSHIKIEVTEAVAIDNTAVSAEVIQALRRLGVVVCLDDFGTGYASLSWLHQFPVDEIKIDKSFVAHMTTDRRSHILVGAAIGLAHSLGLPVVAEGVETREQLEELREMECEYVQGYLFSRPLALADAQALLSREVEAHAVVDSSPSA